MIRGDICMVSGGKDYAGKPHPAVFGDLMRLDQAMLVFLGLAVSPRAARRGRIG